MAGVEPRDIQTCVIMCRKSFGVTAAKMLERFSTAANIVAAGAIPGELMVFRAGSLFATGAMVGTLWSYFFFAFSIGTAAQSAMSRWFLGQSWVKLQGRWLYTPHSTPFFTLYTLNFTPYTCPHSAPHSLHVYDDTETEESYRRLF